MNLLYTHDVLDGGDTAVWDDFMSFRDEWKGMPEPAQNVNAS